MKIKKYTIDEEIPDGAVFMFYRTEAISIPGVSGGGGYPPMKEYFYFLVKEEKAPTSELHLSHGLTIAEQNPSGTSCLVYGCKCKGLSDTSGGLVYTTNKE